MSPYLVVYLKFEILFILIFSKQLQCIKCSSVEVRVLCRLGGGGLGEGVKSSLIGQKCKMADGKQPSDWTLIQDGNSACDWTRIQDGKWKSSHLIGQ